MSTPREVVDQQLAAYNRRDIEGSSPVTRRRRRSFNQMASCSPRAMKRYGHATASCSIRVRLHADIRNRIEVGLVVVDEEYVTGFALPDVPSEVHAVAVYLVTDDMTQGAHLFG